MSNITPRKITLKQVERRVEEIRKLAAIDYESAHAKEDALYRDFVDYVAAKSPGAATRQQLATIAGAVAKTQDIEFARHCA